NIDELAGSSALEETYRNQSQLVLKESKGKCGLGTYFLTPTDLGGESLVSFMKKNRYDLVETHIQQHHDLSRLSPSAVNTVRIITQLDHDGNVDILGCRLRISVDSKVDNMAAGNMAAEIDAMTGQVVGLGYYSDITKSPVSHHPVTGVVILGFN